MSRPKRKSPVLDKAQRRSNALATIDPKLTLGEDLTLAGYNSKIDALDAKLKEYNDLLAQVDSTSTSLDLMENDMADMSDRMLKGVASQYGRDSEEYGQAGGTRKSEIKRSRKANITTLAPKLAA
jgi:hypothetical protein